MSLKKTTTISLDQLDVWGSLFPLPNTQLLPTYSLSKVQIVIGRTSDCGICINDKRLSGKHCCLTKDGNKITITDFSTNGTFIGSKKIGKGVTVELKHLDQIWLLTASKVPANETIGLRVELVGAKEEEKKNKQSQKKEHKQKETEENKKKQEDQKKMKESNERKTRFSQSIKDQITCPFCFEIMSIPVSVQPCNHRFCGGCLSQLVANKKDACIQCRKELTTAVRDAGFTSIIDDYLKTHPEEKRDPKQEEELKAKNIFGFDPINIQQTIHGKVAVKKKAQKSVPAPRGRGRARGTRAVSDLSASDDDQRDKCRQCLVARNGFQCSATQVHVVCHTCGKLIAQRDDPSLHQCCTICTTYYCNLYYPPCKTGAKLTKLQDCRQKCKIEAQLLRGNKFQFDALRNFLLLKKLTGKDVFDRMMESIGKGKFSYLMDKKIMKVAPLVAKSIKIDKNAVVCDLCWNDLWFQMVIAYRMEIASDMPSSVKDRPVCYWGINCRTMEHNEDHVRKYNHCLYQSKF